MTKQRFRVVLRVEAEVEQNGKLYLTEHRVKTQIAKFLKNRHIAEGLPCHGDATISVVEVIEQSPS